MEELWRGIRKEEQMWSQKSRVKWLKERDKNTKFFHCWVNGRRRMNFIREIDIDGRKVTKPIEVKEGIKDYFRNHFRKASCQRPNLRGLDLKRLANQ